jgi:uncharacterized membrane protein (UPF0127 family)
MYPGASPPRPELREMKALHFLVVSFAALAFLALASGASVSLAQQSGQPMVLEAEKLTIVTAQGSYDFEVEIADETQEHARGLMFRTELPPRRGMLFDFGKPRMVSMWMKDTPRSLDMVFLARDGTVLSIAERTVPFSEEIISSGEPVSLVLELNAGVARMIGLRKGDRLKHRLFAL